MKQNYPDIPKIWLYTEINKKIDFKTRKLIFYSFKLNTYPLQTFFDKKTYMKNILLTELEN